MRQTVNEVEARIDIGIDKYGYSDRERISTLDQHAAGSGDPVSSLTNSISPTSINHGDISVLVASADKLFLTHQ